jgi:asparagine synthase (glutamine-hydrolysing)
LVWLEISDQEIKYQEPSKIFMIKNIFLHIGVHKTASTTIQNTLFNERLKLAKAGFLYPEFRAGDIPICNHSIPFYSLFCKEPEKYHINVSLGFTTNEAIQQLHHNYCQQIIVQLADFCGETLIISGEDIWLLATNELKNLKAWLTKITNAEVNIRVVLLCRHPVSRFRSGLQGSVCAFGLPMEKAIERNLRRTLFYRNLITAFSEVFGRESITVLKYEDAIRHSFGPAGAFLALLDKDLPDKIKLTLQHDNPASKYETFVLLNAINQTCYSTLGYELQPQRMAELNELFREMPGQKYMLPQGLSKKVWKALSEDANWLCREFSLPEYRFLNEDLKPDSDIWSPETIDFVNDSIHKIQPEYCNILITLINEIESNHSNINQKKNYMSEKTDILIKQVLSRNLTYLSEKRLQSIASTCTEIDKSGIPGIFIEAGCALGGSAIVLAKSKNHERKLCIYDVFEMIPPPSDKDTEDVHQRYKIIAEGKSDGIGGEKYYGYIENLFEVVKSNLKSFKIDPEKESVSLIKGLIQETMKINEPVAFAHIDVDWYEPVLFCLETIFPHLSVGGSIIIDDYYDWEGCRQATDDYLSRVQGQYFVDTTAGSFKINRIDYIICNNTIDVNEPIIYNETNIIEFLKRYSNQEVVFCANPGNAGDALIAHTTYQIFEKLGIRVKIIRHTDIVSNQTIFYAGGGNLVEGKYKNAYHFINNNFRQNREIILLPHTVQGYNELLLSAKNLSIFCREKTSYQKLSAIGFPSERLFLAHDMAFSLAKTEFQEYLLKGEGTANCFRIDQESTREFEILPDNVDISLSWNGELWHRPDFAKNVTHSLACYLSTFETVKTDRLHIAILAGIMKKKVVLYPNNYYKIKAVYDYSMRERFKNVTFHDIAQQNEQMDQKPENNEKAQPDLEKESDLEKAYTQIAKLKTEIQTLMKIFESRSWKLTRPLRDIKRLFFIK